LADYRRKRVVALHFLTKWPGVFVLLTSILVWKLPGMARSITNQIWPDPLYYSSLTDEQWQKIHLKSTVVFWAGDILSLVLCVLALIMGVAAFKQLTGSAKTRMLNRVSALLSLTLNGLYLLSLVFLWWVFAND
jgi:hypothetical protein